MKTLWIIVGLIIIVGGAWYMWGRDAAPAEETMNGMEEDMNMPGSGGMDEDLSPGAGGTGADEGTLTDNPDVIVELTGRNFAFSKPEIRVKKDQIVRVTFTSEEGFHNFTLDEFDAATESVSTGGTSSVTFVPDQVGEFEYYCSVGEHRANGMVGTLIVTE